VAKLYDKRNKPSDKSSDPASMQAAIETFLASCRSPAFLEFGDELMPLAPGQFQIEIRGTKLWVECWGETRSVARRVLSTDRQTRGVLECTVQRFGGKTGKVEFLDQDRPQVSQRSLAGGRRHFSEIFRQMLQRQFPGWAIDSISSGMDLQRSFSPVFPRARVRRGPHQLAALACPTPEEEELALTFALLWFDHLQSAGAPDQTTSLCLFLPESSGNLTAHRLRWLRTDWLKPRLFLFNPDGLAGEVDLRDLGNLDTRLDHARAEAVPPGDGEGGSERWLEVCVRSNLAAIDPTLLARPVHAQVLTFAAAHRNLIDLIAVSEEGRLHVLELKVAEDIHLPLQALDYWMRICWHTQRNELRALFGTIPLQNCAPKLFLIAPAMSFHPTNPVILRYFSPEIEIERIGINSEWQTHLRVVLRLSGADAPISHGALDES
jgi:hypothetical protein